MLFSVELKAGVIGLISSRPLVSLKDGWLLLLCLTLGVPVDVLLAVDDVLSTLFLLRVSLGEDAGEGLRVTVEDDIILCSDERREGCIVCRQGTIPSEPASTPENMLKQQWMYGG